MLRWIAFFDFDGTITSEETFYGCMLRLNFSALQKELPAFERGETSLRDGVIRIFSEVASEKYHVIEEYIKTVPLRDGFYELLVYLKKKGIPAIVISGGITQLIEIALAPYRELVDEVHSVYLDLSKEHMALVSRYDDGVELMQKTAVMDCYSYENAICVGDGITDVSMAKRSALIFARDELRSTCIHENRPHIAWNNFFDILDYLIKNDITNNLSVQEGQL